MSEYSDLFKDPRWQKKRLEILSRDGFACKRCEDDSSELHVHHKYYVFGFSPWEYGNESMITLCDNCHKHEHKFVKTITKDLLHCIHDNGFLADDIVSLCYGFKNTEHISSPYLTSSVISWAMRDKEIMSELEERFLNSVGNRLAAVIS